ncbi:MAG: GNAT family N-acetyltransferase [Flavobacteriales bacterium CG18_big_fil_WC_8_21_14_2_50_32_9]|nr:MAG: GNAT family N-acetyltransferase [Flavobacteriales bacterium CG18_big_fil_WC_8_21_14_2_50_32_9]PIZ06504.1 MAG: GNAT family N-acetyltransferase [Flavobacteriales bacterium CG_4_10_14_0_8_um_filter_32_5]PJC62110.1 MAG: GNAT family N-acetyltransferase [Flavobacteriales bacterium CG_4_9_14_0_2_um_filter_32_27]
MEKVEWKIAAFNQLSLEELFDVYYLRTKIFVVEQNCPYQEVDEKDKHAYHVMGFLKNEIVAVARILPHNISYPQVSIGRVAVEKNKRGKDVAHQLMLQCLQFIEHKFGKTPIKISAQQYLVAFYKKYGFLPIGEGYLEDDIPHIAMIRS